MTERFVSLNIFPNFFFTIHSSHELFKTLNVAKILKVEVDESCIVIILSIKCYPHRALDLNFTPM